MDGWLGKRLSRVGGAGSERIGGYDKLDEVSENHVYSFGNSLMLREAWLLTHAQLQ